LNEDMSRDRHATRVDMNGSTSRDRPVDRVTVPEAAEMMGVTQSAIRKRVQRGTIPWDKDSEGRIYVYVDPSETRPETGQDRTRDTVTGQSRDEALEAYKDQVEFLRRELERKDTLLMSLMQRIPELEAPSEPRGTPETAYEGDAKGDTLQPEERPQKRSWWRQFFGIE
jgi:DNA-binding transcriptional MerR regulator